MSDLQYDNNTKAVVSNTALLEIERKANAVREMTVEEVAEIVRDNRKRAWPPEDCNDIAQALAKLGTIRIVEDK